jgi:hypothetical protein
MSAGRGPDIAAPASGSPPPPRPWYRRPPILLAVGLDVLVAMGAAGALALGAPMFVLVVAVILGIAPWAAIIDEQERPRRR